MKWYDILEYIAALSVITIGCITLYNFNINLFSSKINGVYNLLLILVVIEMGLRWLDRK